MMKRVLVLALTLLVSLNFVGCSFLGIDKNKEENSDVSETEIENTDNNFPVTVGGVTIQRRPERIVVLSSSIVEKIMDLGIQEGLVGVSDYTREAEDYTPCGTSVNPDLEAIEKLGADLLLVEAPLSQDIISSLIMAGVVVVEMTPPKTMAELWQSYRETALALRGTTEGEQIYSTFASEGEYWFNAMKSAVAGEEGKTVVYVRQTDFTLATGDTLVGDGLRELGFKNVAENYTNWVYPEDSATENREDFVAIDFYIIDGVEVTIKDFEVSEFYKGLSATLKDRYTTVDYLAVERGGLDMLQQFRDVLIYAYPDVEIPALGEDGGTVTEESTTTPEDSDNGEITEPDLG